MRILLPLSIWAVAAASAWLLGLLNPVVILLLLIALAALLGMMLLGKAKGHGPVADVVREHPPHTAPATSLADDLSALADLRDKGVLSEQEFEVQKAKRLRADL